VLAAATENVAAWPAVTVWLAGCAVIEGAAEETGFELVEDVVLVGAVDLAVVAPTQPTWVSTPINSAKDAKAARELGQAEIPL
jgi:hypothetical protein